MSYRHDRKTPKTCKQCSAVYLQGLVSQQADLLKVDKENRVSTCNQILYKMILIKYYSNYTLNFTKYAYYKNCFNKFNCCEIMSLKLPVDW